MNNKATQAACQWLLSNDSIMKDQLIQWANMNSGSYETENLIRMQEQLTGDWSELGFATETVELQPIAEIDSDGNSIVWRTADAIKVSRRSELDKQVMLAIHFDTVYGDDSPFRKCEFLGTGILNGPGVVDAKGGLLVMMWALAAVEKFQLADDIGWTAIMNPDEEIGSPASMQLLREEASQHDFGLVFEPCLTDGTLVGERKGSGSYVIVVHGRAAHSGRDPEKGRNAIVMAASVITDLDAMNELASGLVVNVGRIEGGGPLNRVPDLAIVRVNVRVTHHDQMKQFAKQVHLVAERVNRVEGYSCEVHGDIHSPPKQMTPEWDKLQKALESAGESVDQPIRWKPTGGACDGNKLAAFGLPNIDTLGPVGGELHSPKEWVDTSTLPLKAILVAKLISDYSNGVFDINPDNF